MLGSSLYCPSSTSFGPSGEMLLSLFTVGGGTLISLPKIFHIKTVLEKTFYVKYLLPAGSNPRWLAPYSISLTFPVSSTYPYLPMKGTHEMPPVSLKQI